MAMLVIDEPDGWALHDPERAFDVLAWVIDVQRFEELTGSAFSAAPRRAAVARFVVTRVDEVPSEHVCGWWRRQVREALRFPEDAYAEAMAWAAEQLMSDEESEALERWLRREYESELYVERRRWNRLDSEQWFDDWPTRLSWALDSAPSYPLPFPTVAVAHWLMLD
jgi:hypothetical protein